MPENDTIKFFVDDREVRHFGRGTTVKEVLVVLLDGDEGHLFLGDAEEPLGVEVILGDLGIEKHGHIHASRCRRIEVTVEYAANSHSHHFPPTTKVNDVLKWAVEQKWNSAHIDPSERPKLALFSPADEKDSLPDGQRIGTLLPKGDCKIVFELALRERQQG